MKVAFENIWRIESYIDIAPLLPPVSEGWGKVMFRHASVCLSGKGGGYLPSSWLGGLPTFQLMGGTYLSADSGT